MMNRILRSTILFTLPFLAFAQETPFRPDIPRTWNDQDVATFELPLAQRDRSPHYVNAETHTGQAETLDEWFDPARLAPNYVPRGFHLAPGPVCGHEFGLKLSPPDKQALIAFLRTI
jgi:hypothetical protein